jgi:hypothetical protein
MYALRDATATIESIPLIASSIMSKKLAEDLTGLVLDLKRGSGSFLPDVDDVLELADVMIKLGADHGCPCVALITAMDRPLGRACGNALEVEEAIAALKGEGPPDLMSPYAPAPKCSLCAGVVRRRCGAARTESDGTGRAAELFQRIIEAVRGNPARRRPAEPVGGDAEIGGPRRASQRVEPNNPRGSHLGGGACTRFDEVVDRPLGFVITARPGDWGRGRRSAGDHLCPRLRRRRRARKTRGDRHRRRGRAALPPYAPRHQAGVSCTAH